MKIKLLLTFLIPFIALAQTDTTKQQIPVEVEEKPSEEVYSFIENEPSFPGGDAAMAQWVMENIEYPSEALKKNEQGIVYVQFVVEKDGSITDVKVIRGVSPALDNEAKRVVEKMPKWEPGTLNGKEVRVRYTLPIRFSTGYPDNDEKEEPEPVDDKKKKKKRKRN